MGLTITQPSARCGLPVPATYPSMRPLARSASAGPARCSTCLERFEQHRHAFAVRSVGHHQLVLRAKGWNPSLLVFAIHCSASSGSPYARLTAEPSEQTADATPPADRRPEPPRPSARPRPRQPHPPTPENSLSSAAPPRGRSSSILARPTASLAQLLRQRTTSTNSAWKSARCRRCRTASGVAGCPPPAPGPTSSCFRVTRRDDTPSRGLPCPAHTAR